MSPEDPVERSRSLASAMYANDTTCHSLGITVDVIGPGTARLRMRVGDTMLNGHGIVHGGFVFLLADAAFAYACNTYGPVTVAQSAQVTFLQPATVGDVLVADAVERTRFGRNGIYDVTVRRDDTIVAEFRGHSVMLAGKPNLRDAA
jgi:acyl-CoA thioesterase